MKHYARIAYSHLSSNSILGSFKWVKVNDQGIYDGASVEIESGVEIKVSADASLVDSSKSWIDFWSGAMTVEGNGEKKCDRFSGSGSEIGPETALNVSLGLMPNRDVDIVVRLWGNDDYWAPCPEGYSE